MLKPAANKPAAAEAIRILFLIGESALGVVEFFLDFIAAFSLNTPSIDEMAGQF